jgi:S-DNA-T family DNA segregation ATPase FtsK/SpoIIIE
VTGPDLDPLTRIDDPVDGRVAGSTLGVLGLAVPGPDQPEDGDDLGSLIPLPQRETPAIGNDGADAELGSLYELRPESSDGYGAESTTYAERLSPGDLVCLDDGSWVVVDMEPMEDPIAPGSWVISWRDDTDDAGVLSLSDTDAITVRLPLDEELDEGASW